MIKNDPIIAVKDVEISSNWYQSLLGCKSLHDGNEFDILADDNNNVILCLHKWGTHEHPTMMSSEIKPGNGLLLYLRVDNMENIKKNTEALNIKLEEKIRLNENSGKKEFALRDPDGYYLIISEYHEYQG